MYVTVLSMAAPGLLPNATLGLYVDNDTGYPTKFSIQTPFFTGAVPGEQQPWADAVTVTVLGFVPRPQTGGDPTPFHPPWLSQCVSPPW
jgi:hypothetical protein